MSADGSLEEIAQLLSLPCEAHDQDWGVERSDPRRVDEFVEFFCGRHDQLQRWVRDQMVDLVLQSAEEALTDRIAFDRARFARFVEIAATSAPERTAYWRSLKAGDGDHGW